MSAIGRGLMVQPKLLMLDELSLVLPPVIVEQLTRVIKETSKAEELLPIPHVQKAYLGM